jgi:hypothetical protein
MRNDVKPDRIIMAVVAGALSGGAGVGLWLTGVMLAPTLSGSSGGGIDPSLAIGAGFASALVGAIAFLLGIIVVGSPVWTVMHRIGATQPWSAAVAGGLLSMAGATALTFAMGGARPGTEVFLLGLDGLVVGWLMQRIAYGRPKPPPARPS